MAGTVNPSSAAFTGTQMRPDLFEPVTADWAGKVADNCGWLAHNWRHTFIRSDEPDEFVCYAASGYSVFNSLAYYPQGIATVYVGFHLYSDEGFAGDVTFSATCTIGTFGSDYGLDVGTLNYYASATTSDDLPYGTIMRIGVLIDTSETDGCHAMTFRLRHYRSGDHGVIIFVSRPTVFGGF